MNETTKATHTPGPWDIGFDDNTGHGEDGEGAWIVARHLADINGLGHVVVWGGRYEGTPIGVLTPEDARLIAAAPDLLAALEAASAITVFLPSVREVVDAAIAKARGES